MSQNVYKGNCIGSICHCLSVVWRQNVSVWQMLLRYLSMRRFQSWSFGGQVFVRQSCFSFLKINIKKKKKRNSINSTSLGARSVNQRNRLPLPALPRLNKLIAALFFYHVRRKCQRQLKQAQPNLADMSRLDVKSVQGSLTKEIGFYAERASIHNTP